MVEFIAEVNRGIESYLDEYNQKFEQVIHGVHFFTKDDIAVICCDSSIDESQMMFYFEELGFETGPFNYENLSGFYVRN